MTGKFTENVHNMGYATGKALHSVYLCAGEFTSVGTSSWTWPPTFLLPLPLRTTKYDCLLEEFVHFFEYLASLPTRYRKWWWNLLQNDPLHVLVETLLLVFCIALVLHQRRADWKTSQERKKGAPTEKEVEELLAEWKESFRKPLAYRANSLSSAHNAGSSSSAHPSKSVVVDKIEGARLFLQQDAAAETKVEAGDVSNNDSSSRSTSSAVPSSVLNFATLDYLSSASSPLLKKTAREALSFYGCGSCGPRGFYGTIDAHLELEEEMARFLGTESAILYSDGASAATSTVAAFAKRGDLLIVDEGVNEALLTGVTLSRANVRYFRHNDMKDLRRVLEKVKANDESLQRKPTDQRRFLVVEGLYRNWGTISPLKEIVQLKEEFHYRLILDDSHAIGTLGENGKGSLEHAGLSPMVHAEIVTFSLENALGSVGGMTVGSEEVVDHQRLSGAGYCFSASAPPFLSKVATASIKRIRGCLENENQSNDRLTEQMDVKKDDEASDDAARESLESANTNDTTIPELAGKPLLQKLHANRSHLYNMLMDSTNADALKLRHRLVITSNPLSSLIYLRLSDEESSHRTRLEQTDLLDKISHLCLQGGVAIVSTGGHVKKFLQLVPEPCLRVVANTAMEKDDVKEFVRVLGEAVQEVMGDKVGG